MVKKKNMSEMSKSELNGLREQLEGSQGEMADNLISQLQLSQCACVCAHPCTLDLADMLNKRTIDRMSYTADPLQLI